MRSARREAELELRTQQLEAANQELEAFAYSVSHDLRAPLRAISGFAEILARRHRASLDDQARHYLDNIVRASANMGMLIDDLLRVSRLGRSAVRLRDVDVATLVEQTLQHLSPQVRETGASITVAADLPTVHGDPTLLGQVFTNLLDNALTYRRPDVATQIDLSWGSSAEAWTFAVADNGIGIAADQFEKIFRPFQRLHSYDEYPGTGIGLALVNKAVQMLGGRTWVESTPGEGSTFRFTLPKAPARGGADVPSQTREGDTSHV
jgi:light-regulated signal transduction histidine kinase (bacteriophytochrome)